MEFIEEFIQFKDDFATIQISPIFPEYSQLKATVREARGVLQNAPVDHDERWKKSQDARDVALRLSPLIHLMDDAREDLNKEIVQQKQREEQRQDDVLRKQKDIQQKWVHIAIIVPAALLAIATLATLLWKPVPGFKEAVTSMPSSTNRAVDSAPRAPASASPPSQKP